jgi:hypothetical protein
MHAAVLEVWVQRYHGPAYSNDVAIAVVRTATAIAVDGDGNVVVRGSSAR